MSEVKVFSTPTCVYCSQVKKYLEMKGVPFTELDAFTSEEYKKLGVLTVPVIVYGDRKVIGPQFGQIAEIVALYRSGSDGKNKEK